MESFATARLQKRKDRLSQSNSCSIDFSITCIADSSSLTPPGANQRRVVVGYQLARRLDLS